jgi:hypothetical protein
MLSVTEKPLGKAPNFKGAGYAIWVNKSKTGAEYLNLLDERTGQYFALFAVDNK